MKDPVFDADTVVLSNEAMQYSTFSKQFTIWRKGQVGENFVDPSSERFQFPNNSLIHQVSNYLDANDTSTQTSVTFPAYLHERFKIYLKHVVDQADESSQPLANIDRVVYRKGSLTASIMSFFRENRSVHRILSESTISKMVSQLVIFDYTMLKTMLPQGRLIQYRKYDIILRTILDKVATQPSKHHFILFPLSNKIYKRTDFIRAFSQLNLTSLKFKDDTSFYSLIHFLGFIYSKAHTLRVTPWYFDQQYWRQAQKKDPKFEVPTLNSTSLFDRLDPDEWGRINIVLYTDTGLVIYNLMQLSMMAQDTPFFDRVYRQITTMKLTQPTAENDLDQLTDKEFDKHVDAVVKTLPDTTPTQEDTDDGSDPRFGDDHPSENPVSPTSPSPASSPQEQAPSPRVAPPRIGRRTPVVDAPLPFVNTSITTEKQDNLSHLDRTKSRSESYTPSSEKRIATLLHNQSNLVVAGDSLGDLVREHYDTDLSDSPTDGSDIVVDPHHPVPIKATSTLDKFHSKYISTGMKRDIASVLTSFNRQGLFVHSIEHTPIRTRFDRIDDFKVKMVDMSGKQHSIAFSYPHVDTHGHMLINGVKSQMSIQQVNKPICKVSSTRVNLASNFNKTIVTRSQEKAHDFHTWVLNYLNKLRDAGAITVEFGVSPDTTRPTAFEYGSIGKAFSHIKVGQYNFCMDYTNRYEGIASDTVTKLTGYESQYGTYCGTGPGGSYLFWDMADVIHRVNGDGTPHPDSGHFVDLLDYVLEGKYPPPQVMSEYTSIKLRNKNIPIIILLAYEMGLEEALRYINLDYTFYPKGRRVPLTSSDIRIRFADGFIVFSRYPLTKSLVAAGLDKYDLSDFTFDSLNSKDIYTEVLSNEGLSANYVRAIESFYEYFIDPITRKFLIKMGEPTNVTDLLLRATQMLSTQDYIEASAMAHHRLRGYERFPAILYNEISRKLESYHDQKNYQRPFSINPKAVYLRIVTDNAIQTVDEINPMHELKMKAQVTFSGVNGRSTQSFVVNDRRYPDDAVGIMSESTPDSGKVAYTYYTSADPKIKDTSGSLSNPLVSQDEITPENLLSVATLTMPSVPKDDGKRINFVTIQLSHHLPCENSTLSRVVTGYEMALAQRCSRLFSARAKASGVVIDIDEKNNILKVAYDPQPVPTRGPIPYTPTALDLAGAVAKKQPIFFAVPSNMSEPYVVKNVLSVNDKWSAEIIKVDMSESLPGSGVKLSNENRKVLEKLEKANDLPGLYIVECRIIPKMAPSEIEAIQIGDTYTSVAGSHVRQRIKLNVRKGEKIKEGDIIAYNSGFFSADPFSKQVSWLHGVMTTTALMEHSANREDGSIISRDLVTRLSSGVAHVRYVPITNQNVIYDLVKVGQTLETTDTLFLMGDADTELLVKESGDSKASFMAELNRKPITARYHGTLAEIDVLYACDPKDLHPTIRSLVRNVEGAMREKEKALVGTDLEGSIPVSGRVPVGTKYQGTEFLEGTVLLQFILAEDLPCTTGDKVGFAASNKSVVSRVMEKPAYGAYTGQVIDAMISARSVYARIVSNPFDEGVGNVLMKAHEDHIIDIFRKAKSKAA